MLQFLFFAVLAFFVWRKAVPRSHFIELFAMLLERPERLPRGPFDWLRGVESVGGEYEKRPVTLVLHYKRGEHRMGYLTLGMATAAPLGLRIESNDWKEGLSPILDLFTTSHTNGESSKLAVQASDARAAEGWLARPEVRKAVDALAGRHNLSLTVDGGWLRVTWMPIGFFIFPGRFDAEKWHDVLANMLALAVTLDDGANAPGARSTRVSRDDAARLPA